MGRLRKTILITGCARGIGYATLELLVKKKYLIYAGVRSLRNASKVKDLAKINSNVRIIEIDYSNENSIRHCANEIKKDNVKLDVIINNAGLIVFGPIETINAKQFYHQFQVNLFGPILLTQEFLPIMREQKKGHIIFLGSTSGVESHGMYGAYCGSKFALEAIVHALAVNLFPWNIKVSLIELSATATLIAKKSLQTGKRLKKWQNPYETYTKKQLVFLQELLNNGIPPGKVAQTICETIENPKNQLRYFATEKAKETFENSIFDYEGLVWKREAVVESKFF